METSILKIAAWFIAILFSGTLGVAQDGFIPSSDGNSRLHYRIVGDGPDTLVVPDGGWQYPYYKKYSKGVLYIIYDCRNRGYSETNPSIGLRYDVDDLESVRQFFRIKKMNALGWSYLGGVVAMYASKYPENAKSIIQVGPIPIKQGEHFQAYLKSTVERRSKELDAELGVLTKDRQDTMNFQGYCRKYYEATLYAILSDSSRANELAAHVPCDCVNEYPENIKKTITSLFADLGAWDWSNQVKSLKTNTLIIHGVHDNIPIESSKLWAATNSKSQLLTFSSSGHMPFAEEPKRYFQSIERFISGKKIK